MIFSHAFVAGGFGFDPLMTTTGGQMQLGTVAVIGFFGLSGFLLARSREGSSLPSYLRNRALRIVPGLWVCLGFIALVVVPIAVALGGRAIPEEVLSFVVRAGTFSFVPVNLGGLYAGNARDAAVDGPLWTLPPEVVCYLLLAVLPRKAMRVGTAMLLALSLAAHVSTGGLSLYMHLPIAFMLGSVLYLEREHIPFSGSLAAGAVVITALSVPFGALALVAPLTLPYVMIWIGLSFRVPVKRDLSYGVYIYGWPIQSLLAMAGATAFGVLPYFAISLVPILAVAFVSWTLVEAPALRLRGRRSVNQVAPASAPAIA